MKISREDLVADAILEWLTSGAVGVVVDGLPQLHVQNVVKAVAKQNSPLFVCSVGRGKLRKLKDVEISERIESAVAWRNDPANAGRIVVFLRHDVPKTHSLEKFERVSDRDIAGRLIRMAEEELSANEPERRFWQALFKLRRRFPLKHLEEFVAEVASEKKRPERIPRSMWVLGLVSDDNVLSRERDPKEQLERNRQAIEEIGQLSEQSRKRMVQVVSSYSGSLKRKYNKAYQAVMEYFKLGSSDSLKMLSLEILETLIKSGKPLPKSPTTNSPDDEPRDPPERPLRGKKLDKAIADVLVSQDRDRLDELSEFGEGLSELYANPGEATETFTLGTSLVEPNTSSEHTEICRAIAHCCSDDAWGGWFESDASSINEALRRYSPEDFHAYDPSHSDTPGQSLLDLLDSFDEHLKLNGQLGSIARKFVKARKRLVVAAPLLMCLPFVPLATDAPLRRAARDYLARYEELIQLYKDSEASIAKDHPQANRLAITQLLRLDVVHIKLGNEWKALTTPLHPFFLWRYQEVLKALEDKKTTISDDDRPTLIDAMANVPQLLHFLVSSPPHELIRPLPLAGSLYELPTFENDTNRYLGVDGIGFVQTALELWLGHAPYSVPQIRVAVVDPPSIRECAAIVAEFLDQHPTTTVVADVYRTRAETHCVGLGGIDFGGADYEVAEHVRSGRLVLRVPRPLTKVEQVEQCLEERPVHICLAFDQGEFELYNAPRAKHLIISPLVVTYQYEYDPTLKRGTISPSTDTEDDGIFWNFHFLIRRVSDLGPDQLPRIRTGEPPNVSCLKSILASERAQWLVCADRNLSAYALAEGQDVIQLIERREGQREIGVWSRPSERTLRAVHDTLARFPLDPDLECVRRVFRQFAHVAATGWPTLLQAGARVANKSRQDSLKGALGTILAAAWYISQYPDALLASLDSELAKQWLTGRDSNKRADLVGVRPDGSGGVIVEPLEVKSKTGSGEVKVEKKRGSSKRKLSGKAIDQLNEMLDTLRPIFGQAEGQPLFTNARREALKYQLHRECFREIHSHRQRKSWYDTLQDAFSQPTPRIRVTLQGMVIQIRFEELGDLERVSDSDDPIEYVRIGSRELQRLLSQSGEEEDLTADSDGDLPDEPDDPSGDQPTSDGGLAQRTPAGASSSTRKGGRKLLSKRSSKNAKNISEESWSEPVEEIETLARGFRRACESFSIKVSCETENTIVGPNVIRFYFKLGRGQRRAKLQDVLEDIGREMRRSGLVITAIQNSDQLALDVPRLESSPVLIDNGLAQLPELHSLEHLPIPIGVTPEGEHIVRDLNTMPHMLVAGTTGAGKTVFLYGLLSALLSSHSSSTSLKILLSSSKREDFSFFKGLKHLEGRAVIDDAAATIELFHKKVLSEISDRKELLDANGCRDIVAFNRQFEPAMVPFVIIIDEFADLADQLGLNRKAKNEFYTAIRQVAQAGRSRGVHLVLCTQRPSAQLIPTDIRSLMNLRVAFRMNKREDSQMIIEESGAEQLQMLGDLLIKDDKGITRALGYFTDTDVLMRIVNGCS